MKTLTTLRCAILGALICLSMGAYSPAEAVRVWNVGDNYVQPPGTPKGKPQLIVSGVRPGDGIGAHHKYRYLDVQVVAAGSGDGIENAMVYLVRKPEVKETVVYNTDRFGSTRLWNIDGCWRELVVTDGMFVIRQFVSIPGNTTTNIVVTMPYICRISLKVPPIECEQLSVSAVRKDEKNCQFNGLRYVGKNNGKRISIWVPEGRYEIRADAYDKGGHGLKRYVWGPMRVSGDIVLINSSGWQTQF